MEEQDELVGLWETAPFEYGSMEAARLVLLADGSGWGLWENAAGGAELTIFVWVRVSDDAFRLIETQLVSGEWRSARPGVVFADDTPPEGLASTDVRYTLSTEVPPLGADPVLTLTLDPAVQFADRYALARREVSTGERPTVRRP